MCESKLYPISLTEKFAARSAWVDMMDDNTVTIGMWTYRPERTALEQGQPTPVAPPDGYEPANLPTDYMVSQYDLITGVFKPIRQQLVPFRSDFCRGVCEQQVLDKSPDGAWQLVAVRYAWSEAYNGLWLVHKDYFERRIAPFLDDEIYRPSVARWRWQNDS